jgi:hypothetical protein
MVRGAVCRVVCCVRVWGDVRAGMFAQCAAAAALWGVVRACGTCVGCSTWCATIWVTRAMMLTWRYSGWGRRDVCVCARVCARR